MRTVTANRKMLPYAIALTLLGSAALLPAPAHGMTLGNVNSQSMLGQPLRVVIPVEIGRGESLNSACIKLVADNVNRDAPPIVAARIQLDDSGPTPRLIISSPKLYMEPAGTLSVQIGCGSTTRRDYVLLFEPAALQPSTAAVVGEADEAPWTRYKRVSETRAAATPRSAPPVLVASAMPRSTWGTPVPPDAPAMPVAGPAPAVAPAIAVAAAPAITPAAPAIHAAAMQAKPAEPPVMLAMNAPPRELITLVPSPTPHSGGFIGEAAAASLPPREITSAVPPAAAAPKPATTPPRTSALSLPINPSRVTPSPSRGMSQQVWQYAAAIFGTVALTLLGLFGYHRYSGRTRWIDPKGCESMKGETQAGAAPTFAHFGVMTEAVSIRQRVPLVMPAQDAGSVEQSELDTLLADIQASTIDERHVKDAYKAVAIEGGIDVGADSILKAIAEAERDLQMGTPEPGQVALDHALDVDLLTIPNIPKSSRAR